jgi:hypothetical protein
MKVVPYVETQSVLSEVASVSGSEFNLWRHRRAALMMMMMVTGCVKGS